MCVLRHWRRYIGVNRYGEIRVGLRVCIGKQWRRVTANGNRRWMLVWWEVKWVR